MFFQLPTGKTIYLSIDEYLNLTDSDIQYLIATNSGDSIINPFMGSAVNRNSNEPYIKEEYDYYCDDDDSLDSSTLNIDDLDPDDFPSYEGDNEI